MKRQHGREESPDIDQTPLGASIGLRRVPTREGVLSILYLTQSISEVLLQFQFLPMMT